MRGFRDRDFLQTKEGLLFCIVGSIHPTQRVIAYIKYVPSKSGIWGRDNNKFCRILKKYTIPNLLQTFNYLETKYPHYLFHSRANNITMTAVPKQYIKKHFKPEEKLDQLRRISKLDSLQKLLLQFITFLEDLSNLSSEFFGVTGSLLLDIHQPTFSDLDITVYGTGNSWKLKKALTENFDTEMPMHRLTGTALRKWATKKAENYPLTLPEALKVYSRKWNLGTFGDRWVSIHPVKLENEITDEYEKNSYKTIGQVTLKATVYDDIDSIFLPAVYKIKNTEILNGPSYEDIDEVVTYESLYDSLAENGETIQASGKLEQVTEKESNREHHRLVVGSTEGKGREYIKLVD